MSSILAGGTSLRESSGWPTAASEALASESIGRPKPTIIELEKEEASSSIWLRPVGMAALICLGSILILFPAWLPRNPELPVEDGAVELLQLVLLSLSAAFLLATSHTRASSGRSTSG